MTKGGVILMSITVSIIPTLRFYREMLSEHQIAKANGINYVWWISFIGGIIGDILFFLASSFIVWGILF